ncbi:hypothetical protein BKA70DRAFT_1197952 [Coprinopsis sp. MPI-PUGE-AT-0042]|nr:hypothetical protein BKA70DRAFT_1197952 [Coprinopsis sp. MPI-PUGE-AT-0042]
MESPTSVPPGIRKIPGTLHNGLGKSVEYIRTIYNTPVRGIRTRKANQSLAPTSPSVAGHEREVLHRLCSDTFKRSYVIRSLTSIVAYIKKAKETQNRRETKRLLADTAALLAICAGAASAGVMKLVSHLHGSFSPTGGGTISINVRDVPSDNLDYGSVGAQTWGGACVMAEIVVENPARFGLLPLGETSRPLSPFTIFELGAGTGLASLAIASFYRDLFSCQTHISQRGSSRGDVEIVASDYYPSVLENLETNPKSNGFVDLRLTSLILFFTILAIILVQRFPLDQPFDMGFGADIGYEEQHAVWRCLKKVLRRPLGTASTRVLPLRSTHTSENGTIETVFRSVPHGTDGALREDGDVEKDLVILDRETIICEVEE